MLFSGTQHPKEVFTYNVRGAALCTNLYSTTDPQYGNTYILVDAITNTCTEYINTASSLSPSTKKACKGCYRVDNDTIWHDFDLPANVTICSATKGVCVIVWE